MTGENSAFATLGLSAEAGRAEVDEAYRRLIKRYHPDRTGGDCSRAAEINRAYTVLRQSFEGPVRPRRRMPVPVQPRARPRRRSRAGWMLLGAAVVAAGIGAANTDRGGGSGGSDYAMPFQWPAPADRPASAAAVSPLTSFDEPLQAAVIDRAVADAVQFDKAADPAATLAFSRACHNKLREDPSLTWFDACAAFDEAVVILSGANPLLDPGPFNTSSVMTRQMGAARLLSHDMLAADSRLNQIRTRVELALIPKLDEAARQPL
ncbi:MAG: J domain-containing protein [Sphingomicrobium sp.]